MKMRFLIALAIFCFTLSSRGATTDHLTIEELQQIRLPEVVLKSVTHQTPAAKNSKPHVEVTGVIGEHIQFELLLPDEWNDRFAMRGGGGFVGTVQNMARFSVNIGYATVGTDTGHQSQPGPPLATWAYNDIEAKVNFGYLAVHRPAEVAKPLIRAYYRKDPTRSYFLGCSRGGGQAMM